MYRESLVDFRLPQSNLFKHFYHLSGTQHSSSYTFGISEYVCNSCKLDNHTNQNHTMFIQDENDEDDVRTTICKCPKCLIETG